MKNDEKSAASNLRQKAEEELNRKSLKPGMQYSKVDLRLIIQELQVHQIELQMQNEELIRAKLESEVAREKYQELYDFAPSGYFTLSRDGEILELNLCASQMLGKERSFLVNTRLGFFISDDTKPLFNHFLEKVFNSNVKEHCEVIFTGNEQIVVHLIGVVSDQGIHCLMTSVDITGTKAAEVALKKSSLLLNSSLESQKDTILLSIDLNYRYLYFNKTHKEIMKYAYNTEIELGMNILDCITSAEDRIMAKGNYDRALKGESHTNIREFGGVQVDWYESFFNPIINEKNEIVGATVLARNITERKRIEWALKQKLGEMEIYYELAITRERKMIALKSEINMLLQRLGEEPKY